MFSVVVFCNKYKCVPTKKISPVGTDGTFVNVNWPKGYIYQATIVFSNDDRSICMEVAKKLKLGIPISSFDSTIIQGYHKEIKTMVSVDEIDSLTNLTDDCWARGDDLVADPTYEPCDDTSDSSDDFYVRDNVSIEYPQYKSNKKSSNLSEDKFCPRDHDSTDFMYEPTRKTSNLSEDDFCPKNQLSTVDLMYESNRKISDVSQDDLCAGESENLDLPNFDNDSIICEFSKEISDVLEDDYCTRTNVISDISELNTDSMTGSTSKTNEQDYGDSLFDTNAEFLKVCSEPRKSRELQIKEISQANSKPKKYFCVYCKQMFSKLVLHLERIHKDKVEVKKMLVLPKGCCERKKIIEVLRNNGSYEYNTQASLNDGDLILTRRPKKESIKRKEDFKFCPVCKGMFSKKSIRKHYPKCIPNWKKGDRSVSVLSKRIHGDIHYKACPVLKNVVFPVLREDLVIQTIRYDTLVIEYGNHLCLKYRLPHLHKMIRTKLRLLGRFLLALKHIDNSVTDFTSAFCPQRFDNVIEAVHEVAQLDPITQEYKAPATARDLGTALKKCGNLLEIICIREENEKKMKEVQNFLKLLQLDLNAKVNKTVSENMLQRNRNKSLELPSIGDVTKFNEYLHSNCKKYYDKVQNNFSFYFWKELTSFTLVSIQTFNRRRAGEIERATIEDFKHHQTLVEKDDPFFFSSLPKEYQLNAKKYVRFEIRGKKARGVPVLLSKSLLEYVKLILKTRERAGVTQNNPYLFGVPGSTYSHLRACELMRRYAEQSEVSSPHLIRGTQLRKQLATHSAVMDLNENEVNDLANFMGHNERIHRNIYRIPIASREIGRVSKLLERAVGNVNSISEDNSQDNIVSSENKKSAEHDTVGSYLEPPRDSWNSVDTTVYGKQRCVSPIGHVSRLSWNEDEKSKALHLFESNIAQGNLPSLNECTLAVKNYSELNQRSPAQLKAWVANQIKNKKGGNCHRIYWTSEEKSIMNCEFKKHLGDKILPSLKHCSNIREKYPILQHRSSESIKAWINNTIRRNKKDSTH